MVLRLGFGAEHRQGDQERHKVPTLFVHKQDPLQSKAANEGLSFVAAITPVQLKRVQQW